MQSVKPGTGGSQLPANNESSSRQLNRVPCYTNTNLTCIKRINEPTISVWVMRANWRMITTATHVLPTHILHTAHTHEKVEPFLKDIAWCEGDRNTPIHDIGMSWRIEAKITTILSFFLHDLDYTLTISEWSYVPEQFWIKTKLLLWFL